MKRYIIFFLLTCLQQCLCVDGWGQGVLTQQFVDLPAADYPVTSEGLPTYAAQFAVNLPSQSTAKVRLEFPEYIPLTPAEQKLIETAGWGVAAAPVPNYYTSYSRRQGYVDVTFCPIVYRDGQWLRLTSVKLVIEAEGTSRVLSSSTQSELSDARWKSSSVLASGRWVKIRVTDEGIYRLSAEQLSAMGFNDITRVKVYGYGGRIQKEAWTFTGNQMVPDDLCEVACYRENTSLYFFAEGTVRWTWNATRGEWKHENQPYSNYSYYFLTEEGETPTTWKVEAPQVTTPAVISQVKHYAVIDNDAEAYYEGGREMYDSYDFANGNVHQFRLSLIHPVPDSQADINVAMVSSSASSTNRVQIELNDELLGTMSMRAYTKDESGYEGRSNFTANNIAEDNDFQFTTTSGISARLNYIRVTYDRVLDAGDTGIPFSANQNGAAVFELQNATEATHVWRIADGLHETTEMTGSLEGTILSVPVEDASARYVVFTEGADYPSPDYVGEVENQNLHADTTLDMVIIVPASGILDNAAERLATLHQEKDGLRVKVVHADLLYNEFSSGTPDASAYRRYLKMLYDRAEDENDMPKYLLLFGDCAWDNRMLTTGWRNYDTQNFLLAFEVNNLANQDNISGFAIGALTSYVTDDFYGWLDDNEGESYTRAKLDLAIGRIPCNEAEQAEQIVDKIVRYRNNEVVGAWKNRAYMLADDVNDNLHMEDAETVVGNISQATSDDVLLHKVYWDAYPIEHSATGNTYPSVTRMLQDDMSHGAIMFNYMGHGSPEQVSTSRLLVASDFSQSSDGRLPLWVLASCEISPYDRQLMDIGRTAMYNPDGGAVAVVCASRSVYSNYNRSLNSSFSKYVFTTDANGNTLAMGEALRRTKVELVENSLDATMNKLKYVLLGDPAIALSFPTRTVRIDSINGLALSENTTIQLEAGAVARFSGYVLDDNGNADGDFWGTVTGTVFDRLETITCKNNSGTASTPMVYQDRTKQLFEGTDSIRAGRFELYMPVPRDISYTDDAGLISLYAVNSDHSQEAHGTCEQFYLNGTYQGAVPDTLGPHIYMYLNTPDFPNGGIVSASPVFMAQIEDDSGINASGVSIGHDMELTIDGNTASQIVLNDYFTYDFGSYSSGMVTYPLDGLTDGKHTLTFRVWDVNNNSSNATLDFYVGNYNEEDIFSVHATQNPVRSQTSFVLTLTAEHADATYQLEIYDIAGRKIWSDEGTMSSSSRYSICSWSANDSAGAPLPSGIYFYKAKIQASDLKYETDGQKLILLNN